MSSYHPHHREAQNGVSVETLSVSTPSLHAGSPTRQNLTMTRNDGGGGGVVDMTQRSPSHSPLLDKRRSRSPMLTSSPTHESTSKQAADKSPRSPMKTYSANLPNFSLNDNPNTTPSQPAIGLTQDDDIQVPSTAPPDVNRVSPVFHAQRSKNGHHSQSELSEGKLFSPGSEKKEHGGSTKLSKRESLKLQKRNYRTEKKRAAKELLSTLKDPSVIVMADWLKIRGTLKSWTKMWCVLKPGLLVLYKSQKQKTGHWVGTILLNTCELIERPSKKDGFCYKLFHPLDQSIWATKGPKGESIGAITQPLPYSYLIFRAPSEQAGKCWMDALELALRCSSLLMRSMNSTKDKTDGALDTSITSNDTDHLFPTRLSQWEDLNESDCERHFRGMDDDDCRTDKEEGHDEDKTETDSDDDEEKEVFDEDLQPLETPYMPNNAEELGQQGDACQTEEVADENKSLIWTLVKQVRPGMDLSKVVLPTFILEPRSFLDKLSDYYYHADFLADTVLEEDPYSRIKGVVRWYIAGFYKKPKGLKKPYNPILGETFRSYWKHPKSGARTFYISEQISHHPPVSAFYVTNRQDGFSISGSILAKSKFYGNSVSAIMDGVGRLTFLKRGEDYHMTMPYAHCKGILIGTLTMELGGKVTIECEKTGYRAELEFKLKPFLGSGEASNKVSGKIKLGEETLATIDGKWDQEVQIKDKYTGETGLFWSPTDEIKRSRLVRYTVPVEAQAERESERLWQHVSAAIDAQDQNAATHEKFLLEDMQRREAKERKAKMEEHVPSLFERDEIVGDWVYKFADLRPWDPMNDVLQYENNYHVKTKTRHRMPVVRTTSITNVDDNSMRGGHKRATSMDLLGRHARLKRTSVKRLKNIDGGSESSSPEGGLNTVDSESETDSEETAVDHRARTTAMKQTTKAISKALEPLISLQKQNNEKLGALQGQLMTVQRQLRSTQNNSAADQLFTSRDVFLVGAILLLQLVIMWLWGK